MKNIFIKKKINILCPNTRIDNYLAYCGHVFEVENVNFFQKVKFLKDSTDILFLDLNNLINNNLKSLLSKKIDLIIILLWNSDRDYFFFKKKIFLLKKKFKVRLISPSNFSEDIYFGLNNFTIKRKSTLKSIKGISILKRIKYNFPFIFGIYNFIKYFKDAKTLIFSKKLVYVGIGDKSDVINQLLWLKKFNYSNKFNKTCNIISKDINKLNYIEFNKKFYKFINTKLFQDLPINLKFYLTQVTIKYLVLSHLNNFKNFYHKNNSSYPLDLLRTGIYRRIYHLNFGNSSGNAKAEMRQIYLEKFYNNKYLDLRVFKNNENFKIKNIFKIRFKVFHKKLIQFYKFKDYSANLSNLLREIKKLKTIN